MTGKIKAFHKQSVSDLTTCYKQDNAPLVLHSLPGKAANGVLLFIGRVRGKNNVNMAFSYKLGRRRVICNLYIITSLLQGGKLSHNRYLKNEKTFGRSLLLPSGFPRSLSVLTSGRASGFLI